MNKPDRTDANLKAFREQKMTTKDDVLQGITKMKAECRNSHGGNRKVDKEYLEAKIREIDRFEKEIQKRVIFDAPEDWWAYALEMRSGDISLFLEHYTTVFPKEGVPIMEVEKNERYCLVEVKSKMITVDEYARLNGIKHVAAVARIRRGKLRCAVKFGKEWRIPLLSPPIKEGYTPATYTWDTYLNRLPVRYELFNDYNRADFFQDQVEPGKYHVRFSGDNIEALDIVCDRDQKGTIELLMIAHPNVVCESEVILRI